MSGRRAAMRGGFRDVAGRLRHAVPRESRRRRAGWVVIAAVMVLGPVAFNLARASTFTASVDVYPVAATSLFPPVRDPGYYRPFLADSHLRDQMKKNLGVEVDSDAYGDVTLTPQKRGPFALRGKGGTPEEARAFVDALGSQLAVASRRALSIKARAAVLTSDDAFRRADSSAERRRLQLKVIRLQRLAAAPPPRIVLGERPKAPKLERAADKLVDRLPGSFPGRPSPILAGLAGLLLAVALWAVTLMLVPPAWPLPPGDRDPGPEPEPEPDPEPGVTAGAGTA